MRYFAGKLRNWQVMQVQGGAAPDATLRASASKEVAENVMSNWKRKNRTGQFTESVQAMQEHVPTVFVVDDDPHYCISVRQLLESVLLPVEVFSSAKEFLRKYDMSRPGCLILDLRMPEMSGLELLRILTAREQCLPIIMVTAFADIPSAVEAMQHGARDFMEKPYPPHKFIDKVQQALLEDKAMRERIKVNSETSRCLETLTPREREIMDLLLCGKNAKQVSRELKISVRTADYHRRNMLNKMGVDNLVQLGRLLDEFTFRQSRPAHPK